VSSFTPFPQLKESYRKLGPKRFWAIMLGALTWSLVGVWLERNLDYPHAYGSSCRHKCLIEEYWYSPTLLSHGGVHAYLMFAWLWALVVLPLGFVVWLKLRSRPDKLESTSYISDPE